MCGVLSWVQLIPQKNSVSQFLIYSLWWVSAFEAVLQLGWITLNTFSHFCLNWITSLFLWRRKDEKVPTLCWHVTSLWHQRALKQIFWLWFNLLLWYLHFFWNTKILWTSLTGKIKTHTCAQLSQQQTIFSEITSAAIVEHDAVGLQQHKHTRTLPSSRKTVFVINAEVNTQIKLSPIWSNKFSLVSLWNLTRSL